MSNFEKYFIILFMPLVITLSGCSTGKIRVESEPKDAMVKLIDPATGRSAIVGTTPIDISPTSSQVFEAELLNLEVIKDGYHTERFWLPNAMKFDNLSNLAVQVTLKPKPQEPSSNLTQITWNEALQKYVESQRFITKRKYRLAEAKLHEAIELVGEFPEAKKLMGTIQFLKGSLETSEKTWREMLNKDPNDREALRMIRLIRKEMGEKTEAE